MRATAFCAMLACLGLLLSTSALPYRSAGATDPIGNVNLRFGSPALELTPGANVMLGSMVKVKANVVMDTGQIWTKKGVVLDLGTPGSEEDAGVNSPCVIYADNEYKMWYSGTDGVFPHGWILYANSSDGITWNRHGVVLSAGLLGESANVHFSYVMKQGPVYKMWYTGYDGSNYRIFYATSDDGMAWTRQGQVLDLGPSGSYDDYYVYNPVVLYDGVSYTMWYDGNDHTYVRILRATSPDGVVWTKQGVSLNLGAPSTMDDAGVGVGIVLSEGGGFHMWYTGSDGVRDRIFYAISDDGISWTDRRMILDIGPASTEGRLVRDSTVLHVPGMPCQMWYTGRSSIGVDRIHYAEMTPSLAPTSTDVDFYLDDLLPGSKIGGGTVQLSPLPTGSVEITWTAGPLGRHTIYAWVDPLNNITEASETDNFASIELKVFEDIPVADAGQDQTVFRNQVTVLDGTGSSDPLGHPLTYLWIQVGLPPAVLLGADTPTPLVIPPLSGVLTFKLTVHDPYGAFANDTVNVTVINRAPTADAGPDATGIKRVQVLLDGTGSTDPDSDALSYSWTQMSGPAVTVLWADTATAAFTPQSTGVYNFSLTVDDNDGGVSSDSVEITVSNASPVADAGSDLTVRKNTLVTLEGVGSSDPDGDSLTYAWAQLGGPSVVLSGANTAIATFTSTMNDTYSFRLTVDDGDGGIGTDTVIVNVTNADPFAYAGHDITARKYALVTLNGSGSSDADGDPLTFDWVQTGGPTVSLTGEDTAILTFTPTRAGLYEFTLTVTDVSGGTGADTVQVTVTNSEPVVIAHADSTARKRATVTLDGSGTHDVDGDSLTYSWTQIGGPSVTLTGGNAAVATFVPTSGGVYSFMLTVNDGDGGAANDTVQVTVTNSKPVVIAWSGSNARKRTSVTLDGSATYDADGDTLTFEWTQTGGPTVDLAGANTVFATFTPVSAGTYSFMLDVDDGDGGESNDTVQISVANSQPVALAGTDISARKNMQVTLSGSLSSDADGDPLSFAWTQTDGPTISLSGDDTATPDFTPTMTGVYTFRLDLDDGDGGTDSDTVVVNVWSLPPAASLKSDRTSVQVNGIIRFDAGDSTDPDGTIISYSFDFGDGTWENGTLTDRNHTYTTAGRYAVTLTVTDSDGNTSMARMTILVNQPAPAPHDLLADIWWPLIIVIVLVVVAVLLVLERRKWKGRALEAEHEAEQGIQEEKA